jgi:hypothetical protein
MTDPTDHGKEFSIMLNDKQTQIQARRGNVPPERPGYAVYSWRVNR